MFPSNGIGKWQYYTSQMSMQKTVGREENGSDTEWLSVYG